MTQGLQNTEAPLMLSVSGARGIIGRSMTPIVAAEFAAAYGSHLRAVRGIERPIVCLARDSRPSGEMLAAAVGAALTSVGCRVIELGIVATPTVGVMIDERHADAGMVVTASHNPIIWNGLKCLDADGLAPSVEEAAEIIDRFQRREFHFVEVEGLAARQSDESGSVRHVERVLQEVEAEALRSRHFKVVLDSVNGAGCEAGRLLLERLGCEVIHMNGEPTGQFAHAPEPLEENLSDLCYRTEREKAVCGFAQDPDADRLAVVDENGRYIGEEYTLVLAAKRLLDITTGGRGVVTNLSTSRMIDDLAAGYGGVEVLRTAVGEANVANAMKEHDALIGGEGNGGVIFPPVTWVRDSLSAMALVLGLLAEDGRPLSAIVSDLPRYHMIKRKIDVGALGGRCAIMPILHQFAEHFREGKLDRCDGVRVDLPDGWAHLRPSNTEPIIRIIAEAASRERAEALVAQITALVNQSRA